jgi:hypothetical protein
MSTETETAVAVVTGVVALVAGILLVSAGTAQDTAHGTRCLNNNDKTLYYSSEHGKHWCIHSTQ